MATAGGKGAGKRGGRLATLLTLLGMAKRQWDGLDQEQKDRIIKTLQERGPEVARKVADQAQRTGRAASERGRQAGQAIERHRRDFQRRH